MKAKSPRPKRPPFSPKNYRPFLLLILLLLLAIFLLFYFFLRNPAH